MTGVFTFVVPTVILGAGIIAMYNRPLTNFIYSGIGILVVGYITRYSILGIRTIAVIVAQSPVSLENASAVAGAGYLRRLVSILLPMHKQSFGFIWLLALIFCMRDLETAVLYYPPGWEPLTVRILTLEANSPGEVIAGLALVQVILTAILLIAGLLIFKKRTLK